jgi:hypothetical protein
MIMNCLVDYVLYPEKLFNLFVMLLMLRNYYNYQQLYICACFIINIILLYPIILKTL